MIKDSAAHAILILDESIEELKASNEALTAQVESLVHAVKALSLNHGGRLNRQQLAERLGVHRNTVAALLSRDRSMPRPVADGKWFISDIIEWEMRVIAKQK